MIHRRKLLVSAALGVSTCVSATSLLQAHAQTESDTEHMAKTFVLVHGAWHGGWCWRDVRRALIAAGHRVFTPTLTGLGERSHLLNRDINLSTHAQDVVNLIKFEELQDIILVGHSYAGLVVSLVTDELKDRIAQVVYLDAVLPKEGEALISLERQANVINEYGESFTMPVGSTQFLGVPEDHKKLPWLLRNLVPHPLGTLLEPVKYNNGGISGVPKAFIRCKRGSRYNDDNDPALNLAENNSEWTYYFIDEGHDVMITDPDLLTEMLMSL